MDKKSLVKTVLWSVVLLVLLGGVYFLYGRNSQNSNISGTGQDKVEGNKLESNLKAAYDFELTDLEGNTVKLSDYKGKIVFVNFWATWCPPCKGEMPEFNEADKEFKEKGDAVLLAVNLTSGGVRGETEEAVRKFVKDNGYTMKVLLDKEEKAAQKYNISSIPTTYVIDREGNIYTYHVGAIDKAALFKVYDELKK